jgi:hypothetical protein
MSESWAIGYIASCVRCRISNARSSISSSIFPAADTLAASHSACLQFDAQSRCNMDIASRKGELSREARQPKRPDGTTPGVPTSDTLPARYPASRLSNFFKDPTTKSRAAHANSQLSRAEKLMRFHSKTHQIFAEDAAALHSSLATDHRRSRRRCE